ncbi:MAG TPA: phenylalanine--tRNA ligase subunit beta [Actinomycetota bacterium]|nr:phenylalanine--tRNA ligase subunit beta [Actinomycetota bacterium]
MKVSLSWLREFVPIELDAEELAARIDARGIKVEGIERPWDGLDGVVVATVIDVRDHPNSEKLCLASVDAGDGPVQVVVGIRNMAPGDLVPWAKPGSRVPLLEEPLGSRSLRGEMSNGMLCSPRELAISQEHETGILILPPDLSPGADLKTALGLDDALLDIEVEPNRPDFLSIYGVARETSSILGLPLAEPETDVDEDAERADAVAPIELRAPDGCPYYLARVLRGASRGATPVRAQARLTAAGMRPVAPIVDATNYAMLELGQPLHAFDLDRLAGPGIVVRRADAGERLVTLDGVERELIDEDLLICDLEKPVALAGVMGGRSSEVSRETRDVLLEAAHFTRTGIIRTARRLDLHSEASHRFERGTDPEGVELAARRCAALIARWTGARVLQSVAQAGGPPDRRWVSMRASRATALLGYPVTSSDAAAVFDALRMSHREIAELVEVEVPGYRVDIEREVDLIEEVVRIQGYEGVGATIPRSPEPGGVPETYAFGRRVRDALVRAGLREAKPLPFASEEDLALMGDGQAIPLANPLRAEEAWLRTSLLPGLLRTVARNQRWGSGTASIFEVGVVFRSGDPAEERRHAGFVHCGAAGEGWAADDRTLDVLDARGTLESLLGDLGVEDWSLGEPLAHPFHPGRSARILLGDEPVGALGELHPRIAASLEIEGRVAAAEIQLEPVRAAAARAFQLVEVPRFPPVRRDLAFVVPTGVSAGALQAVLDDAGEALLDRSTLFDVFEGGAIPEGRKSLAFALEFRAPDRTLTDEEVEPVVAAIVDRVRSELGAELRA